MTVRAVPGKSYSFPLAVASVVVISVLFLLFLNYLYNESGASTIRINSVAVITGPDGSKSPAQVPFYRTFTDDQQKHKGVYTATIPFYYSTANNLQNFGPYGSDSGDSQDKALYLVFPAVFGNGLRVTLNDVFIGEAGDMEKGNSARWNCSHAFKIPPGVLKSSSVNYLAVSMYALYEYGIVTVPFIAAAPAAMGRYSAMSMLSTFFITICIGVLLMLGVFFILFDMQLIVTNKEHILIGIMLLLLSIYYIDYLYVPWMPVDYSLFKKISLISLYISVLFFVPGIHRYLRHPLTLFAKGIMGFTALGVLTMAVAPLDTVILRKVYRIANFCIILLNFDVALVSMKHLQDKRGRLFFLGNLTLTIFAARDIGALFMSQGVLFYSYFGVLVFCIFVSFVLITEVLNYYGEMLAEKKRADLIYEDSLHDELTRTFNRKVLHIIDRMLPGQYIIAMTDLDDFKRINDTYGHAVGDEVLRVFSAAVLSHIRTTDYCIRFGGDEFLIILQSCTMPRALEILNAVRTDIDERLIDGEGTPFRFTFSTGLREVTGKGSLNLEIRSVDMLLYEAKRSGVGKIASPRADEA